MAEVTAETKSLRLGDMAPNFTAETTEGTLSFYDWIGDSWCIFFSHPKDFTPVCTTELGEAAKRKSDFAKRNTKVIALSVDPLNTHHQWIKDINETQRTTINYPLIADTTGAIAELYGMLDAHSKDTMTVRSVFIIDPQKKIRLTMTYPANTGRNFFEILRVLDSLQLTDKHGVATPANWQKGTLCIIQTRLTDPQELKTRFPKGWTEIKPYLRLTPQPE